MQALLMAAAARVSWLGFAGSAAIGLAWLIAALLDHAGEVLFESHYRAGQYSNALEVGIVAAGAALAVASLAALRTKRHPAARPGSQLLRPRLDPRPSAPESAFDEEEHPWP